MSDNTKDNFIMHDSVQKPLRELESLAAEMKKKKAEIKKAMFYAKHPGIQLAKEEIQVRSDEAASVKFNEAISAPPVVSEPVLKTREPPVVPVRNQPVQIQIETSEPIPILAPVPAPAPASVSNVPFRVPFGGSWL